MSKQLKFSLTRQEDIDNSPIEIGVNSDVKSLKLGATGFLKPCETCGLIDDCHGHPGKLTTDVPLFKPAFNKSCQTFEFILKCICPVCGLIRIQSIVDLLKKIEDEGNIVTKEHQADLRKIRSSTKQTKLKCCNVNCQKVTTVLSYNTKQAAFIYNNEAIVQCAPEQVYSYLKSLPYNFLKLFSSLEKDAEVISPSNVFFNKNILIISNFERQPNIHEDTVYNPLTADLNKFQKLVAQGASKPKPVQLQLDVIENGPNLSAYTSNKKINLGMHTSGGNKNSIQKSCIMGKKTINNSRSVIGPGHDEIGKINLPQFIIDRLENYIYFNNITKKFIIHHLRNNPTEVFTSYIKRNFDKERPYKITRLEVNYKVINPQNGDMFGMKLDNGNFVTSTRSPALHKWNLQAAEVSKLPINYNGDGLERTVTEHTAVGPSFNSDNDGDEKGQKVFSNECSNIELGLLMNTKANLKHQNTGTTMFGLVQDQIIGINKFIKEKNISRDMAFKIFSEHSYILINKPNKEFYSGKELFSYLFPEHFTLDGIFKNGELIINNIVSGMVSANSYNSIFNGLSQVYSNAYAIQFINIIKIIVDNYIRYYGLSITFSHIIPDPIILEELKEYVNKKVNMIDELVAKAFNDYKNKLLYLSSFDDINNLKLKNIDVLTEDTKKKLSEYIDKFYLEGNMFKHCIDTEFKVSMNDVKVLIAFMGQKSGKEFPKPKLYGKSSITGIKNNLSITESGFIKECIVNGLNYNSFCTMVQKESLTQIVQVTSETADAGVLGKKSIKSCDGFIINFNRFVVSRKHIIDFNTNFLKISMADISYVQLILPNKELVWENEIKKIFETSLRKNIHQFLINRNYGIVKEVIFYVNMFSIISNYYYESKSLNLKHKPINEKENLTYITDFVKMLTVRYFFNLNDTSLILYVLLTYFDPSGFIFKQKLNEDVSSCLTKDLIYIVFEKIIYKLNFSLSPGERFGSQIAHTIQEKNTQQTLSSFHTTTKAGATIDNNSVKNFKALIELSNRNLKNGKGDVATCISDVYDDINTVKKEFEYISLGKIAETEIKSVNQEFNKVCYESKIEISLLNQFNINIILLFKMFKTYCTNCFVLQDFSVDIDIEDGYVIINLEVQFKTFYKSQYLLLESMKNQFGKDMEVGIHKGKMVNSDLYIENITSENIDADYNIKKKTLYKINFYIESLHDFKTIDTNKLLYVYIPQGLSYECGGIHAMKNNTIGKANSVIGDINFVQVTKHFFGMRFMSAQPILLKTTADKDEIIKSANHGNNKAYQQAAFLNQTDNCNDMYACLLAGTKPTDGTNYYNYLINPNIFDRLEYKEVVNEIDDDDEIISII